MTNLRGARPSRPSLSFQRGGTVAPASPSGSSAPASRPGSASRCIRTCDLHGRLHRGAHRPLPSRRVYIPKPDGRRRPLAVAALEDKIVQRATTAVLNAIYEEDFLGFSYGFRPGRGAHDAMDALVVGIESRKVNFILDADIRSFFDTVDQEWLIRFVEHRVGDRRIVRLIRKWLKAGVLEDGIVNVSDKGTGQGAVISPLLANNYLHYGLDQWAEGWRRHEAAGDMIIVRYADDCVPRTYRRKEVRCCARDGGRSSGAGRQGKAPNHRKLRRSRAVVVSVAEKAGMISSGVAQRGERKQTADDVSKAYRRCRNRGEVVAPGRVWGLA